MKVHGWRKSEYQPDPNNHLRTVVDGHLHEVRTTPDVFWSKRCNSYVLVVVPNPFSKVKMVESWYQDNFFRVGDCSAALVSVNGEGEVRWDVTRYMLESALRNEEKLGARDWWKDSDPAEQLAAARHFGLIAEVK